jgi:hypothetical protein
VLTECGKLSTKHRASALYKFNPDKVAPFIANTLKAQPVTQLVTQPVTQPVTQLVTQLVTQPVTLNAHNNTNVENTNLENTNVEDTNIEGSAVNPSRLPSPSLSPSPSPSLNMLEEFDRIFGATDKAKENPSSNSESETLQGAASECRLDRIPHDTESATASAIINLNPNAEEQGSPVTETFRSIQPVTRQDDRRLQQSP